MQKTQQDSKKSNDFANHLLDWARKDAVVIIVFIFALGACAYTIYTMDSFQDKINDYWFEQWDAAGCSDRSPDFVPVAANFTFDYGGDYSDQD